MAPKIDAVPVIGRRIDEAGIKMLRDVLAKLESGAMISIGVVGELSDGGTAILFSPGVGEKVKLCGAAHILARRIEDQIIGALL